jgi:outer membrane protein TolC
MQTSRSDRRLFWLRSLGGLAAPVLVSLTTTAALPAGDRLPPAPVQSAPGPLPNGTAEPAKGDLAAAPALAVADLPSLRRLALDKQPALAAYRASLAAAQLKAKALDELMVPTLIRKDLPIRRQQASRGVSIAEAQLCQAEWQTLYAVTRNYLSALYALEQQQVAADAINGLQQLRDQANRLAEGKVRPDVQPEHVQRLDFYLSHSQGRQEEAIQGYQRALAALREAVGIGPDCPLEIARQPLPDLSTSICREEIIKLALARRGDYAQAVLAAEVVCLEVDAQSLLHGPSGQTFAAAADIHATAVPQGSNDPDYKPGGLSLEMPTILPGSRNDRVEQARALSARAAAVADKTRNLIILEAEDAWLRWQEASRKKQKYAEARQKALAYNKDMQSGFALPVEADKPPKYRFDDVINANLLAAQAKLDYNQALYQADLALAALERATAGGFLSGLDPQICNTGGH